MTAINSCRQAALGGVAQIALIGRPGDIAVVASTAKASLDNIGHLEVVAADAHLESEFGMTNLAAEADAVEPMGEYHRPHTLFFGPAIENHVSILGRRRGNFHDQRQREQEQNPSLAYADHFGGTAPGGIEIGREGRTT